MKKENKVSVIIPVYKVESYLDRCVNSVVNQSYRNLEIILVDDGSPDKCPQMCDDWAKRDSRIKVIHKQNGGLSDARNAGIDAATGEYVAFLDSDDSFSLDFSKMCEGLADSDFDVKLGDYSNISAKLYYYAKVNGKRRKINFLISACLKIYKKEFLNKNNIKFKFGVYHEDVDFGLRILLSQPKIEQTNIRFYVYNVDNPSSITREYKDDKTSKRLTDVVEIIKDIKKDYPEEIANNKKNFEKYISNFLFNALKLIFRIKDENIYKQLISYVNNNKEHFARPLGIKNHLIVWGWNLFGIDKTTRIIKRLKHY